MKNLKLIPVVIAIASFMLESCSTISSCDRFRMGVSSRGASIFEPGAGKALANSKTSTDCVVTIFSKLDHEVNVYIDTVWQGSLAAKGKGFISLDGGYSYMHAVSKDGQYFWVGKGDCTDDHTFRLTGKDKQAN